MTDKHDEEIIERVEKWSKEHPRKTRQTEMLKLFPKTRLDRFGVVWVCPVEFGAECERLDGTEEGCEGCRAKWWGEVIE